MFCPSCPEFELGTHTPPGILVEHGREQVHDVLNRWGRVIVETLRHGFFPNCNSTVSPGLRFEYKGVDAVLLEYDCDRGPKTGLLSVGMFLMGEPTVISFLHEHGFDLAAEPFWRLPFLMDESADVVSESPAIIEKRIRAGTEVILATIADQGATDESERRTDSQDDGHDPTDHVRDATGDEPIDVSFERLVHDDVRATCW